MEAVPSKRGEHVDIEVTLTRQEANSADGNARAIATSKRRLRIPPGSDRMAFGLELPAPLAAILEEEAAKQRALDDGGAESGG